MAKVSLDIAAVMGSPDLSLTSSPFAVGKVIIKRASFKKGGPPPAHLAAMGTVLQPGWVAKGDQRNKGTGVYKGRLMPKVAIMLAAKYNKPGTDRYR